MINLGKHNLLGIGIDAVDYAAAVEKIIGAAKKQRSFTVSALAVHGVMTGALDETHGARLNQLDLVLPDGQPVRWALNWLHGLHLTDRVYGPTLTLKVCECAAREGLSIYLYGSRTEVLKKLSANLCQRFPGLRIAGSQPSLFRQVTDAEKRKIAETIVASGASIVLVGLGCPRQEVWIYEYRNLINLPMLAVGAAFDFHAGTQSQAPALLQKYGLEWFYRLVHEPRRLWKRYLLLNPLYLTLVAKQMLHLQEFPIHKNRQPLDELRYG
ncbi:MAG: WecB/TagA/CpsF family glycosyltransferase [Caldilineaceae bacterium]